MWQVDNRTPFASAGYFARDRNGAEHWVVAVCATFAVRSDGLVDLHDTQRAVRIQPEYRDDSASELLAEADFAPFRPKTDLVILGAASGIDNKPAERIDVGIAVGAHFHKRVHVHGARRVRRSGKRTTVEAGAPVEVLPLRWTHALGGTDVFAGDASPHPFNPVGTGWTARWNDLPDGAEIDLPPIENAAAPIAAGQPLPDPCGLGAMQPGWRPRIDFAGTYDHEWSERRAPLPPEDFSERFHNAAPPDQVLDLKGGEAVSLGGLHPDGPYAFRLPQIVLEASTRIGRRAETHGFRLVGVELDATARSLAMIWNASLRSMRDVAVDGSTVSLRQMAGVAR